MAVVILCLVHAFGCKLMEEEHTIWVESTCKSLDERALDDSLALNGRGVRAKKALARLCYGHLHMKTCALYTGHVTC